MFLSKAYIWLLNTSKTQGILVQNIFLYFDAIKLSKIQLFKADRIVKNDFKILGLCCKSNILSNSLIPE